MSEEKVTRMQVQKSLDGSGGQVKFTGFEVGRKFKKTKNKKEKTRKTELNVSGKSWFE